MSRDASVIRRATGRVCCAPVDETTRALMAPVLATARAALAPFYLLPSCTWSVGKKIALGSLVSKEKAMG